VLGGTRKIRITTLTRVRVLNTFKHKVRAQRDCDSLCPQHKFQKSLNPFTRALAPPFIGRRRDFHIPITPLASENIPSVNAYMIVFFI
jgi:hypothetical protein